MSLPDHGTAISVAGYTAHELPEGWGVEVTEKVVGRRRFHVEWADRTGFAKVLKGYVRQTGWDPIEFVREQPQTFPGYDNVICTRVSIKGGGAMSKDTDDNPEFEWAVVDAFYEAVEQNPGEDSEEEDVLATHDMEFEGEFYSYGSRALQWKTGKVLVKDPMNYGKLIALFRHSYTRRGLPEIPETTIRAAAGKVNAGAWHGFAAETLRFDGPTTSKTFAGDGTVLFDVTYHFMERPQAGWNKYWNATTGEWDNIQLQGGDGTDDDNLATYETANFSSLF